MIISARAIPAYQKSSCIQNVAHDLVKQTSLRIKSFLSSSYCLVFVSSLAPPGALVVMCNN